jgi:23S rRNA (pseudouridine1915-N3)-methyltransferase
MSGIRCVFVGRLKAGFAKQAVDHYAGRIARMVKLEMVELKDAPGSLPAAERTAREGGAILGRLSAADFPVCLDERGKSLTSRQFAATLQGWIEDPRTDPCFVIGGPYGLAREVREACGFSLRLGRMTLPHELARIMLLEQIYRGLTIVRNIPYHND